MANQTTMAELLASQDSKNYSLSRGQELEGQVILITSQEIILDLGSKAEGVLPKKDLTSSQLENLKVGDKFTVTVLASENESGQALVTTNKQSTKNPQTSNRWQKFEEAQNRNQSLIGRGMEVNKGGLIVEVNGVRGFLPASQVALSKASNLEDLIGKDIQVIVIEVDNSQNRLIFSQKSNVAEETKKSLNNLQIGDQAKGTVAAVLPFGIFVSLENNVEGLVHISEISWEKVEDPSKLFKVGDQVEALIISIDPNSGRVNLSLKQLMTDPFQEISKKYSKEDVIKGTISKIASTGLFVTLEEGIEGFIPTSKIDSGTEYQLGQTISCLVDSVDTQRRRVNLVPFITTTKGLIYK